MNTKNYTWLLYFLLAYTYLPLLASAQEEPSADSYLAELDLYIEENPSHFSFSLDTVLSEQSIPLVGVQNLLLYDFLHSHLSQAEKQTTIPLSYLQQFDPGTLEFEIWKGFAIKGNLINAAQEVAVFDVLEGLLGFRVDAFGDVLYHRYHELLPKASFTYIPPIALRISAADWENVSEEPGLTKAVGTTLAILAQDRSRTFIQLYDPQDFNSTAAKLAYLQLGYIRPQLVSDAYRNYLVQHRFKFNDPNFPTYYLQFTSPFSLTQLGVANQGGKPVLYVLTLKDLTVSEANRFAQVLKDYATIRVSKALYSEMDTYVPE